MIHSKNYNKALLNENAATSLLYSNKKGSRRKGITVPWNKAFLSTTIAKGKPSAIFDSSHSNTHALLLFTKRAYSRAQRQLEGAVRFIFGERIRTKHRHKFHGFCEPWSNKRQFSRWDNYLEVFLFKRRFLPLGIVCRWDKTFHFFVHRIVQIFFRQRLLKAGACMHKTFKVFSKDMSLFIEFIYNAREPSFRTVCSRNLGSTIHCFLI